MDWWTRLPVLMAPAMNPKMGSHPAMRRNRAALASGQLALLRGDIAHMPFGTQQFDKIFAVRVGLVLVAIFAVANWTLDVSAVEPPLVTVNVATGSSTGPSRRLSARQVAHDGAAEPDQRAPAVAPEAPVAQPARAHGRAQCAGKGRGWSGRVHDDRKRGRRQLRRRRAGSALAAVAATSIIAITATNAPMTPTRVSKILGSARTGTASVAVGVGSAGSS